MKKERLESLYFNQVEWFSRVSAGASKCIEQRKLLNFLYHPSSGAVHIIHCALQGPQLESSLKLSSL